MCPLTDDMWGEKDGRYYLGEPLGSFEQIPYFAKKIDENQYHKNDLIADIAQFNNLLVMGVSLKGEFHYANKVLRQDSFAMENLDVGSKRYLICAVADGVGSAPFSDQLSDLLVNQIIKGLKERLTNQNNLHYIDWDELSEYVWKISLKFSQINSTNQISDINEFSRKWASTLELIVIDYNSETSNRFAHVTICGDGGAYLLRNNRWLIIKRGKETKNGLISNDVVALPHRPLNPIVKYGYLKNDEALIMVTDGLGDIIERSIEFRSYLFNRIIDVRSLPEFIKTISTSVNQMDDDKTCIVIKHKEINNE